MSTKMRSSCDPRLREDLQLLVTPPHLSPQDAPCHRLGPALGPPFFDPKMVDVQSRESRRCGLGGAIAMYRYQILCPGAPN